MAVGVMPFCCRMAFGIAMTADGRERLPVGLGGDVAGFAPSMLLESTRGEQALHVCHHLRITAQDHLTMLGT